VSVFAACAALLADRETASAEAVSALTSPLDELDEEPSIHAGTLSTLVGRCLVRLLDQHRSRAVAALAAQHVGASAMVGLSLTTSMLRLAFPHDTLPKGASELSPGRRRALDAIRDDDAFELEVSRFGNYTPLLRDWGLPDSREALARWLAVAQS
jgi:hypothetical protein